MGSRCPLQPIEKQKITTKSQTLEKNFCLLRYQHKNYFGGCLIPEPRAYQIWAKKSAVQYSKLNRTFGPYSLGHTVGIYTVYMYSTAPQGFFNVLWVSFFKHLGSKKWLPPKIIKIIQILILTVCPNEYGPKVRFSLEY